MWRVRSVGGARSHQYLFQGAQPSSYDALGLWNEPLWPRWRPEECCGGKNHLPNGGFAGAAASLLVLRVHVVTCLTSKADSGFTSKHAVIDVN